MIVRHNRSPLPKSWRRITGKIPVALEADIRLTRSSRLRAKLLVFENRHDLHRFWKDVLRLPLGHPGKCAGAVNSLAVDRVRIRQGHPDRHTMAVDPRYFCVIGLSLGWLTMEVLAHEAVHAGMAYAKRRRGDMWLTRHEFDEEEIAYPIGRIARQLNRATHHLQDLPERRKTSPRCSARPSRSSPAM